MPVPSGFQLLGQPSTDLVEDQPDERLGAADIGGRHHEVECGGRIAFDKVVDTPVTTARDHSHHRITVQPQKRHRGREHPGTLILAFVQQLTGGTGYRRACFANSRTGISVIRGQRFQ